MRSYNSGLLRFGGLLILSFAISAPAAAAPAGEHLVAGMAEFSRQGGNLTINQLSERAIINWQDFSISHGNVTRFVQPGASSAVLNRVISGNASHLFGDLKANGQVFLINPNGVLVGSTGVIDTRSFVASTLDLSNQDFLDGGDLSFSGQGAGIVNLGRIRGLGGDVFLIAPQIDNQGVIETDGVAGLGAGAQVLLRDSGSERLWVGAAPVAADGNAIDNSGLIEAAQAELQSAGGNVYALSINNSGAVRATTVANEGGRILLKAGSGGTVISSGTLDASSATGQGGHIEVTGTRVGLIGDALVDASGRHGGGEVLIGGDFQGNNAAVMNAEQTHVGAGATIRADGGVDGNGGKVIVWADGITRYYGDISARGGSAGGDGGLVEVSGKEWLSFAGHVDAGASHGKAGSLLLDPKNIVISNAGVDVFADNDGFGDNPGDDATIAPSSITALTDAGTNVILQANNDISILSNIISNNPGGNGGHMTFQAGRSISINANITSDNSNITFVANDPGATEEHRDAGAAIFHNDGQIHAGTGTVSIKIGAGIADADPDKRETGDLMTGNVNAANMVVTHEGYSPDGVVDIGATTLTNSLTVLSNDRDLVNNSGAITVLGVSSFDLGSGDFTVTGLNTDFDQVRFSSAGNVTLNDVNAVRIGQGAASNIAGDLVVSSRGPIGTSGAVIVGGETHLTAVSGGFGVSPSEIVLNNAGNDFQGLVTVNGASSVNLRDSNDLALATLDANASVTLTADGDITSTGRLFMPTGSVLTLSSGVNGDITLIDADNQFQQLQIVSGRDVDLFTTTGVTFNQVSSVSGNLDLNANGTIQHRFTTSGSLSVTGDTNFTVRAQKSDLLIGGSSNPNDFVGTVSMLTAGDGSYRNVSFRNVNAGASIISGFPDTLENAAFIFDNAASVTLPGMTLTGTNGINTTGFLSNTLLVHAPNGDLTQSGPIVLTSNNDFARTRLQVGNGNDITLDDEGNDFRSIYIDGANDIVLRDSNGLQIERIENLSATGNGDLTIVADGNVQSQNGVRIKGMASFDVGGTNNVTLNQVTLNQVGGLRFPSANNVSYEGINGFTLGETDINGTLHLRALNSNSVLNQTGSVKTGGLTTFQSFGGGITLDHAENVFGDVAITSILGNPTITLRENDAITQSGVWNLNNGTLNVATSNNQAITLNNANQFQFVNVTQHDDGGEPGAVSIRNAHVAHGIRQTTPWTTAGTTTLNAGGNVIQLNNNDNTLGDLAISNASAVTIVEDDDITQASAWNLPEINVTLAARNDHDIVLDLAGNVFGHLILSGHDLTVVENDDITQIGGAWTSTGKATLTAGSHSIELDNNANAFGIVEVVSAGDAEIYDEDALVIDGASAEGRLTVSVGGHLTQTGAIVAEELRIIGTGHATLEDENNNVAALAAAFTGGALSYADADDFSIEILGESPGILVGSNAVTLVAHDGTIDGLALINQSTTALDVTANTLEIPAMNIAGSQSYTAEGGITLNNNIVSSAAGAVSFNGPVTLAGNISINTVDSAVNFNDTLDGNDQTLTLTAGTGSRSFVGAVSNLGTPVGGVALLLNGAGTADFHSTLSANNGIISGGPVIFRDDVTLADGNIGSNFSGLVTLGKIGGMDFSGYDTLTFDGGLLLENGPASIVSNNSQLTLGDEVSGANDLTLDAGTSNIVGLSNLQDDLTSLSVTAFSLILPNGLSIAGPQSFTLTNDNGAIELGGSLTSTAAGEITFHSPVLLTANSAVSTTDSAITFEGAVNGARNLTLSSGVGEKHFLDQVGNQTAIGIGTGAAIVLQGNGETFFEDTLRTASGITSEGPVTFKTDATLGNGDTGSTFNGVVTAGDLSIDGYDGIAFNGGLNLVDGILSVTSHGSTISFGDTVQGAQGLTLNSLEGGAGTVTGLEHVATDLAALTISAQTLAIPQEGIAIAGPMHFTASGGITINGDVGNGNSGTIDLVGPVTLATQDITVTTGDANVTFAGTLDGARNLTVNSGGGLKTFGGTMSIGTGSGHALTLQGTGANDFQHGVTLASGILIEDGSDTFFPHGLSMNNGDTGSHFGSGTLTIGRNGAVTGLYGHDGMTFAGDLVLIGDAVMFDSNGADITFSDDVLIDAAADAVFDGNIVMEGALTIETGAGSFDINGSIDGNHAFVVDGNAQVAVNGDIGLNQNVASVSISAGSLALGGEVSTHGAQAYNASGGITLSHDIHTASADINFTGPITLTDDVEISTNADGGNVHFIGSTSTIDGNYELQVHTDTGNIILDGAVGDTTPLNRILLSGHDIAAGRITVDGDDSLMADNNLTITASRNYTEATYLFADNDGDGAGSLILLDDVSLTPTAGTEYLLISAADLDMQGNSSINAGHSVILIDASAINGITLGADRVGAMNISADELSRMSTDTGFGLRALNGSSHVISDIHIDTAFGGVDLLISLYAEYIVQTQPIEAGQLFLEAVGGVIDLGHADNLFSEVYVETGATSVNLRNSADILQFEGMAWDLTGIDVTLRADGHDILLTADENRFGTLSLTGRDATVVTDIALNLGAGALSGSLDVTANGVISQSAPLTVGGDVTLVTTHEAGDVSIVNDGNTVLGDSLIGGDFDLDSGGGDVSQAADSALKVAGTFDPTGSGNVTLNGLGNIVSGFVPVDGDNIIRQVGVIELGDENIDGNLTVISEASDLSFDGEVTAGEAITLTDAGNNFGGRLSITTVAPEIVEGADQQTGIHQQDGTTLTVTGQASFTAEASTVPGSGFIDLTNEGNSFGSLVLNGTEVQVRQETGNMVIDAANAGTLDLHAVAGGISQTDAIVVEELGITAAGQVLLDHAGNDIGRVDGVISGNLVLHTLSALISGDIATGGGNLTLVSGGSITQNSSLVDIGVLTLSADGDIVMMSNDNTIDTLGDITANGGIAINDTAGGLTIEGAISATDGDVTILTVGDMTIAETGTVTVNGSGDVALSATGHFINENDGQTISLDDGRFLIYTTDVEGVTKGGLTGGALFSRNHADNAPGMISHEGNLFIYSFTPTLTLRPEDVLAVYGEMPVFTYTVDGLLEDHTAGQAFTGNPALTSDATAGSNVGFYGIEIALGGIALTDLGYDLAFDNDDAQVEVTPRVIDLSGSRIFNGSLVVDADSFTLGNLYDNQTLGLSGFGTMIDRHVGNGKAVTLVTLALGDGDNGGLASNYTLAGGTHTADITPAALTVSTSDVVKVYDGTTSANGAAILIDGNLFNDDTISGGSFAFTNPNAGNGNKVVIVSGVTVNDSNGGNNYDVTYTDNTTSTISPYIVDLNGSRVYDGTVELGAGIFTPGALVGDETLTLSGSGTMANRHVGNGKAVTPGTLALGDGTNGGLAGNYTLVGGTHTVDITRAAVTLSTGDVSKVYDGTTTANGTAIVTAGQLFGSDAISGGSFAFTDPNAGNGNKVVTVADVTVNDGNNGGNYIVSYAGNTTSTITPASLTISVNDQARLYGRVNPALGYQASGFVTGEGVADLTGFSVTTDAIQSSDVGVYAITAAGSSSNYAITFDHGELTINPAPLVITIHDLQRTYGAENPTLTFSADGFVLGHDAGILSGFSIGTAATTASPVGEYAITGTGAVTNANYALTMVDGILTIDPATLTVNVSNASRSFATRDASYLVTVSGFVNGEDVSIVTGQIRVEDLTALFAPAGDYADVLIPSGVSADNYVIDFLPGMLTINATSTNGEDADLDGAASRELIRYNERDQGVTPLYVYNSIVPVTQIGGVYMLMPRTGGFGTAANDDEPLKLLAWASSFGR